MSLSKISVVAGAFAFASRVAAHGTVTGIVADGVYYEGYSASFQYMATQPVVVGWSTPENLGNGFIAPDAYTSSDIICHLNATNAQTSATVAAGGTVELQWTVWPDSHHGPVIDYLANCGGDCKTVDKTTLEFFKIDGVGLIDDTTVPGTWATDQLIANNNTWAVTIPSDIAPGNYVLRHEIIALHSAGTVDGAQSYPQCVNLEVTGSGTATPSGVLATTFYTETDPGIEINIYQSLASYDVPGPTLYSGAVSATQAAGGSATATAAASAGSVTAVASSSTSAAVSQVTDPSSTLAPYSNSTLASSKKSACKLTTSSSAILSTSSIGVAAIETSLKSVALPITPSGVTGPSSEATSSVEVVEIVTISPVPTTTSKPASISSSTPAATPAASSVTEPEGTTLGDLLSWVSSFYSNYSGSSYNESTIARRHARALRV